MKLIIYGNLSLEVKYDAVKVCKISQYINNINILFVFFCNKYWKVYFLFIVFLDLENISIHTNFMVLPFLVFRVTRESRFFGDGVTNLHFYGSVINIRQLV